VAETKTIKDKKIDMDTFESLYKPKSKKKCLNQYIVEYGEE
jgi:hypothetical protein